MIRIVCIAGLSVLSSVGFATPDAGLTTTFLYPPTVTGTTRNITTFGATAGNASDDDAVAINNAINASSSGDEVLIPNGVWNIQTTITPKTGVAIRGQSEAGAIIRAGFTATDLRAIDISSGRSDITISSVTLDSNGSEPPDTVIEVGSNSGSLTQRVWIKGVTIKTFYAAAIICRTTKHVKVESCTISDATAVGGGGEGYGITIQQPDSENNWVTGNTITGPMIRHGILLQVSAHHNLIENNLLNDLSEDSIDLHGEDEYSNEVRYNEINDCVKSAIGIGNTGGTVLMHDNAGPNNWIHHNTIRGCDEGIEVIQESHVQFIENNDIRNCDSYGIRIHNTPDHSTTYDSADDVSITSNTIRNCKRGILAEDCSDLTVTGNIITENTGSGSYGIRVDNVTNYTITGNNLSCNSTAKQLAGGSTGTYASNSETGPCDVLPVKVDAFVVW